ncbi:MAG: T9SS type A sorting domain-containing protein, partial [Bacteroidetes bacterium]|nr:T9SS type A sorting domain-containing protein [Bacteroidota bacterium]
INYAGEFVSTKKIKVEGSSSGITVNAGGYLYITELEADAGSIVNNGYIEHISGSKNLKTKSSITGDGVFYVNKTSKLKLKSGAKIHGKTKSDVSNDYFITGNDTLKVLRLPMFKLEKDGLYLGEDLEVEDTLNLNGHRIDILTKNFKLPKSHSFKRNGNNSEYIQTTNSGKYKFVVIHNDEDHVAPIGRNPYLPIVLNCEDCEGVEFATAVTQNIYLNPETLTGEQTSLAVGETWRLIPTQTFTGNVTITFQWNNGAGGTTNSELTSFTRANCTPIYWVVGSSTNWQSDGVNQNVAAQGSDPYSVSISLNGMTAGTEYLFGVKSGASALPVEFTHFNATSQGTTNHLNWGTSMEENNDKFEVQRSKDGFKWEKLAEVKGHGTTQNPQEYNWVDESPLNGTNFYRLRQVDFDGKFEFSNVVSVNGVAGENTDGLIIGAVYPNPMITDANIKFKLGNEDQVEFQLFSISGSLIKSTTSQALTGENNLNWNLADIETGNYILVAKSANGTDKIKLVKQ